MLRFFEDYLERLEALHRDLEQAIAGLSVEALDWVPRPDMNSLCVLIVHLTGAERYWIGDMAGQIPSGRDRAAEFKVSGLDETTLEQRLQDSLMFARGVLETLTLDDLAAERPSPNPAFKPSTERGTVTAGWALLHALEHTALHTGHAQIARQLWDQRQT